MKARRGSGNRAGVLRKNRLIAFAIRRFVCAVDVRRQRHMPKPFQMFAHGLLVMGNKPQSAQTKFPPRDDFGFQFPFAEENALPEAHLSSRPDQRFPGLTFDSAS